MTTPETADLVERLIRQSKPPEQFRSGEDTDELLIEAADLIDTLQARVRELETSVLDAAFSDRHDDMGAPITWREIAEKAEAERDEALDSRDSYRLAASGIGRVISSAEAEAARTKAEARVAVLEGALERIAKNSTDRWARIVSSEALASASGEGE